MLLPLLLVFAQFSSVQFDAYNLACWATLNFYRSQPLVLTAEIPQNVSSVFITAFPGIGNDPVYNLRECAYATCTNYNYYNANCPVIATLGFGTSNLTGLLLPGSHSLALDSLHGYASTEINGAVLNVTFPAFSFSTSGKSCAYGNDLTSCAVNLTVDGSGSCFYPLSGNLLVSSGQNTVNYVEINGSAFWNCSSGTYFVNLTFPPLQHKYFFEYLDSNFSAQQVRETLELTNLVNESFADVPFELREQSGFVNLSGLEVRNASSVFAGSFINSSVNVSPVVYNFTNSYASAEVEVQNSLEAAFSFTVADIAQLTGLNCENNSFDVVTTGVFFISCYPNITSIFSNWSFANPFLLTAELNVFGSPASLSLHVSNASQSASQLLSLPVTADPDNFSYTGPLSINFSGVFLSINSEKVEDGALDFFNYSITLLSLPNSSLNLTTALDFSNYTGVSFLNASIPPCPSIICFGNSTIFVTVFNQTNFSLVAVKRITLTVPVSTGQSASPPNSFSSPSGSGGGSGSIPASFIFNATAAPSEQGYQNREGGEVDSINEEEQTVDDGGFSLPLNTASNISQPASFSGFQVAGFASGGADFLPLLAIVPLATLIFYIRKPSIVKRRTSNDITNIGVQNNTKGEMTELVLQEVLPQEAKVKQEVFDSTIGKVITWKRSSLKPGEKWNVNYECNGLPKKGKLCFVKNGKKTEIIF